MTEITFGEAMQEAAKAFDDAVQAFVAEWARFTDKLRTHPPMYIEFCKKCDDRTVVRAEIVDQRDCVGFMMRCTKCGAWVRWRIVDVKPDVKVDTCTDIRDYGEFCSNCHEVTKTNVIIKAGGPGQPRTMTERRCMECNHLRPRGAFCTDCGEIIPCQCSQSLG